MRKLSFFLVVFIGFGALISPNLRADDHVDAPTAIDEPALDIAGLYAFKSPTNAEKLVLILTVNAHQASSVDQENLFSADGKYALFIDNNGDSLPDTTINIYFQQGIKRYAAFIGDAPALGATFGDIVTRDEIKVFAGFSADPFFMDYEGYSNFAENLCAKDGGVSGKGFRCANTGNPTNYYAKFNVGAIVVELPLKNVTKDGAADVGTLKVWAKTLKLKTSRQH